MEGLHILVVEDEFLLAEDLRRLLEGVGAKVIGPLPTLAQAQATLRHETRIDGAVLDVNLAGQQVFPLAETLMERRVPFIFLSGYDKTVLPPRFADIALLEKPVDTEVLRAALAHVTRSGRKSVPE